MLDNLATYTWSIDGTAAAAAREMTKIEQKEFASKHVLTTYLDGSVTKKTQVANSVKKPKATASSNGVKRGITSITDECDIVNPQGITVVQPIVLKIESSVPVGASSAEWKGIKALMIAAIQHANFDKVHVNQEI